MKVKKLRAHFDGNKIVLDDTADLKPNTKLIVTILPDSLSEEDRKIIEEREEWQRSSAKSLSNAYGEDEVEYSVDLIKEPNPEYEGR